MEKENEIRKKKIGILTYHRFINYGGLLQAYALCKKLNELNYDACVIDYRCKYLEDVGNSRLFMNGISYKRNIKKIATINTIKYKEKAFTEFINKNIPLSKSYEAVKDIAKDEKSYDLFITGSDQVWNPGWPYDEAYFLDFVEDGNKKVSFSASLGDKQIPDEKKQEYIKRLNTFNKISVREKTDKLELEKILDKNKEISVTIDPVLLLEKKDWEKFVAPVEEKDYCLIYTVNEPEGLIKEAKEYAKNKGLKLIYLNPSFKQQLKINNGKKIKKATPEEFISYVYNAKAVFTNSFHGTAFSICFDKELFVETKSYGKLNKRAKDLLELLGEEKQENLKRLRAESLEYLGEL